MYPSVSNSTDRLASARSTLTTLGHAALATRHHAIVSAVAFGPRDSIIAGVRGWCTQHLPGDPNGNQVFGEFLGNVAAGLWIGVMHPLTDKTLRTIEQAFGLTERVPQADSKGLHTTVHNLTFVGVAMTSDLLLDFYGLMPDVGGSALNGALSASAVQAVVAYAGIPLETRPVDPARVNTRETAFRLLAAVNLGTANFAFEHLAKAYVSHPRYQDLALEGGGQLIRQGVCWYGLRRALDVVTQPTAAKSLATGSGRSSAVVIEVEEPAAGGGGGGGGARPALPGMGSPVPGLLPVTPLVPRAAASLAVASPDAAAVQAPGAAQAGAPDHAAPVGPALGPEFSPAAALADVPLEATAAVLQNLPGAAASRVGGDGAAPQSTQNRTGEQATVAPPRAQAGLLAAHGGGVATAEPQRQAWMAAEVEVGMAAGMGQGSDSTTEDLTFHTPEVMRIRPETPSTPVRTLVMPWPQSFETAWITPPPGARRLRTARQAEVLSGGSAARHGGDLSRPPQGHGAQQSIALAIRRANAAGGTASLNVPGTSSSDQHGPHEAPSTPSALRSRHRARAADTSGVSSPVPFPTTQATPRAIQTGAAFTPVTSAVRAAEPPME